MSFNRDRLAETGRITLCGSGGGSDCPALRVTDDGKIGISSSEDLDLTGPELVFEGHEIRQMVTAFNAGTVPAGIMAAIETDVARQAQASSR